MYVPITAPLPVVLLYITIVSPVPNPLTQKAYKVPCPDFTVVVALEVILLKLHPPAIEAVLGMPPEIELSVVFPVD